MARTAFYAPAHRVMGRVSLGSGGAAQPGQVAPSFDIGGSGVQDGRLQWSSGASTRGAQVCGWMNPGSHPVLDVVPSTASLVALAALQVPVTGVPLTLVSASGAGITVNPTALLMLPSLNVLPVGALCIDAVPIYRAFGTDTQRTVFYDAATMLERCIAVHSVGNDSGATITLSGFDAGGYPMHQTLTMGSGSTVNTTKAFKGLYSATATGTLSGSNVSIGQADIFGLPFFGTSATNFWGFWNNLVLAGTGTFVAGDVTNPSTALTGDTCGTWVPGSASDGTKRLTLWQHTQLSQMIAAGINQGTSGMAQF